MANELKPSAGSAALSEVTRRLTAAEVARQARTTRSAVGHWTSGRRKPDRKARRTLRKLYEVAETAWDEPAGAAEAPAASIAPQTTSKKRKSSPEAHQEPEARTSAPIEPSGAASNARDVSTRTVDLLNQQLAALMKDPRSMPRERAQVAQALVAANRLLAKVSGILELTEAQIVRSEAWRRVMKRVVDALDPYPDAATAVAKALRQAEAV